MSLRTLIASLLFYPTLVGPVALVGQTPQIDNDATIHFVLSLRDPATGGYRIDSSSPPGLRATFAAVRAIQRLGGEIPEREQTIRFVQSRYDATAGIFHEPNQQPDATTVAVGLMLAAELELSLPKIERGFAFLHEHSKDFEALRLGAAALEAQRQKPAWLPEWIQAADARFNQDGIVEAGAATARETASVVAMKLRLGYPIAHRERVLSTLQNAQNADGGWTRSGATASDLESCYRVMRALHLLGSQPKQPGRLRDFLRSCRNADGGYSVEPGGPSTMSGVYYAIMLQDWLKTD